MPPACQTALDNCKDEEVVNMWSSMNMNLLGAAFREMELCIDRVSIPSHEDFIGCSRQTPLDWNPVTNFMRLHHQSPESFKEQKLAVTRAVYAIDKYLDYTHECNFVKCTVISGSPGSG